MHTLCCAALCCWAQLLHDVRRLTVPAGIGPRSKPGTGSDEVSVRRRAAFRAGTLTLTLAQHAPAAGYPTTRAAAHSIPKHAAVADDDDHAAPCS